MVRFAAHRVLTDGGEAQLSVQSGARCDGIAGIHGNPGNVESVTY